MVMLKGEFVMLGKWLVTLLIISLLGGSNNAYAFEPDKNSDILMLINYEYPLDKDYMPKDMTDISSFMPANKSSVKLRKIAADALNKMYGEMKKRGLKIYAVSAYRNYEYQIKLFQNEIGAEMQNGLSYDEAYKEAAYMTATPGTSEHQAGLTVDVSDRENALLLGFSKTPEGIWLAENSYKYGFILRYPKGKEEITQISFEPWHFRYVGIPSAKYMFENKLCLEEYMDRLKTERKVSVTLDDGTAYDIFYTEETDQYYNNVIDISKNNMGSYVITTKKTEKEEAAIAEKAKIEAENKKRAEEELEKMQKAKEKEERKNGKVARFFNGVAEKLGKFVSYVSDKCDGLAEALAIRANELFYYLDDKLKNNDFIKWLLS